MGSFFITSNLGGRGSLFLERSGATHTGGYILEFQIGNANSNYAIFTQERIAFAHNQRSAFISISEKGAPGSAVRYCAIPKILHIGGQLGCFRWGGLNRAGRFWVRFDRVPGPVIRDYDWSLAKQVTATALVFGAAAAIQLVGAKSQ